MDSQATWCVGMLESYGRRMHRWKDGRRWKDVLANLLFWRSRDGGASKPEEGGRLTKRRNALTVDIRSLDFSIHQRHPTLERDFLASGSRSMEGVRAYEASRGSPGLREGHAERGPVDGMGRRVAREGSIERENPTALYAREQRLTHEILH